MLDTTQQDCPQCDGRINPADILIDAGSHPLYPQRITHARCEHCDQIWRSVLTLIGGSWIASERAQAVTHKGERTKLMHRFDEQRMKAARRHTQPRSSPRDFVVPKSGRTAASANPTVVRTPADHAMVGD